MAGSIDVGEIEAFLVLAEELHFGRTGERLFVSQSRVSQLLRSLEHRVGGRLVQRTSRSVRLTPLGERFRESAGPAFAALHAALGDARAQARGVHGVLRLGFQCTANDQLMGAISVFEGRYPHCAVEVSEVPLNDPFGALRRGAVDAAVVMLPAEEPDVVVGPVFSRHRQSVAVSVHHPFARRPAVSAEELADHVLIDVAEPAPDYWREANAPKRTPGGRPVPSGPAVATLQEGLTAAAADRGAMLLCLPTARYHARPSLTFVPVTGLPPSELALTWLRTADGPLPHVDAFAEALAATEKPGDTTD